MGGADSAPDDIDGATVGHKAGGERRRERRNATRGGWKTGQNPEGSGGIRD